MLKKQGQKNEIIWASLAANYKGGDHFKNKEDGLKNLGVSGAPKSGKQAGYGTLVEQWE